MYRPVLGNQDETSRWTVVQHLSLSQHTGNKSLFFVVYCDVGESAQYIWGFNFHVTLKIWHLGFCVFFVFVISNHGIKLCPICSLTLFLTQQCLQVIYSSFGHLGLISLEQWLRLWYPIVYNRFMTRNNVKILCIFTWVSIGSLPTGSRDLLNPQVTPIST